MSKLILLMIISCILAFASAQKVFLKPGDCYTKCFPEQKPRPYCVKYDDGSIKERVYRKCTLPCGKNIVGYFKGSCKELQGKSHVQK